MVKESRACCAQKASSSRGAFTLIMVDCYAYLYNFLLNYVYSPFLSLFLVCSSRDFCTWDILLVLLYYFLLVSMCVRIVRIDTRRVLLLPFVIRVVISVLFIPFGNIRYYKTDKQCNTTYLVYVIQYDRKVFKLL